MSVVYLDWAATAIPDKEIIKKIAAAALDSYGNPSSGHTMGKNAAKYLSESRLLFSDALECKPEQIVFTSGATESNNMVFLSFLNKKKKGSIIVSALEHPSIFEPAKVLGNFGFDIRLIKPGKNGIIDPHKLSSLIDSTTQLISIMHVNNETGSIQNIGEINRIIDAAEKKYHSNIHFHSDAVQGFGKIPFDVKNLDSASFSGHKIGAPMGTGALYLKKPLDFLSTGGMQEKGLRPGTENLYGLYGFGLAVKKYFVNMSRNHAEMCKIMGLLIDNVRSIGHNVIIPDVDNRFDSFSPYILSIAFPPIPGEVLVRILGDKGFAVSTGSACSSKTRDRKKRGRVITSLGFDMETAFSSIRISIGHSTSKDDVVRFSETLEKEVKKLIQIAK